MTDQHDHDHLCPNCGGEVNEAEVEAAGHLSDIVVSAMDYAVHNGESVAVLTALATALGMYAVQFQEDPEYIAELVQSAIEHFEVLAAGDEASTKPKDASALS